MENGIEKQKTNNGIEKQKNKQTDKNIPPYQNDHFNP